MIAPQLKSSEADQEGWHKVKNPMRLVVFRREEMGRRSSWGRGIGCVGSSLMVVQMADAGILVILKGRAGQLHGSIQDRIWGRFCEARDLRVAYRKLPLQRDEEANLIGTSGTLSEQAIQ